MCAAAVAHEVDLGAIVGWGGVRWRPTTNVVEELNNILAVSGVLQWCFRSGKTVVWHGHSEARGLHQAASKLAMLQFIFSIRI